MASTQVNETLIRREVERLFGEISAKRGDPLHEPGNWRGVRLRLRSHPTPKENGVPCSSCARRFRC
jgi:hypothetical protein